MENIRSNDEFFADIVDTPKEVIEHHRKREYLKGAINKREYSFLDLLLKTETVIKNICSK